MVETRLATHTAFGLRLALEPALAARVGGRLATATGTADLVLGTADAPPAAWAAAEPVAAWDSPDRAGGRPLMRLQRRVPAACRDPWRGSWWRLSFQDAGEFYVTRRQVVQVTAPGDSPHLAELRLLGPVLAFWLELRGLPTLHASAVVLESGPGPVAVAFLARHGGGKSSLVAALLEHGGALLTDDLLALEGDEGEGAGGFRALPAYPQLRLWPADARRITGAAGRWPRVLPAVDKRRVTVGGGGFGRFHARPAALAALLLPRRLAPGEAGGLRLEPLSPAAALHRLVEHSYLRRLVTGAGLQPDRLATLARLVESVPVHSLAYPAGFDRLEGVVSRVAAWVATSRAAGAGMWSAAEAVEVPLQRIGDGRSRVGAGGER